MELTQAQFAERMAVTPLTVHRWETGQSARARLRWSGCKRWKRRLRIGEPPIVQRPYPPCRHPPSLWISLATLPRSCWLPKPIAWPTVTSSTRHSRARPHVSTRFHTSELRSTSECCRTVNFLVRRIEGLGYSDQVAVIHGGLAWPEREEQIERFREPNGARFLVATDAAGEGINLQFCRLMVNYDIPWNPARLEQRMGRIHRYGQKHDVRVVNLVAGGTREGRVLKVLLDKLESVRRALSSDKVFDVIGSLLENTSLREFMIDALTDEGEQRVLQRIERAVTGTAVGGIVERQAKVYGAAGEIAPRLSGMRQELDRERYLHLLPAYVRLFVESAAAKLGIGIQGDPDGVFSLEPVTRGSLDALLPALEGYLSAVRDRLRIRRPGAGEACIWLHPGEPVFDALCSRVVDALAHHARRGAIFIHPRADEAGLWHLAALSVEDDSSGVALAGEFPNPTREAPRPVLETRLLALRQGTDESVAEISLDALLALHCAPGVAPGSVPLASRGTVLRANASVHVERHAFVIASAQGTSLYQWPWCLNSVVWHTLS